MKFKKLKRSEAQLMQDDLNTLAELLGEQEASILRGIASAYLVEPEYRRLLGKAVATADEDDAAIERAVKVAAVPLPTPTATPTTLTPQYKKNPPKTPVVIENDTPEKRAFRVWRAKKASEASVAAKRAKAAANSVEEPAKKRMGRPPKAAVRQ